MKMAVRLGRPRAGWFDLEISLGSTAIKSGCSYTPHDSLGDLIDQLASILETCGHCRVPFHLEPEVHVLEMVREGTRARVSVSQYDGWPARGEGSVLVEGLFEPEQVFLAFWRGVRGMTAKVSESEYQAEWRHPFPRERIAQLSAVAGRLKQEGLRARR